MPEGQHVTEGTVVSCSKSLKGILDVCNNMDEVCGVIPESIHHTRRGSQTDQDMVLADYIPDCHQYSTHTTLHVADSIEAKNLIEWVPSFINFIYFIYCIVFLFIFNSFCFVVLFCFLLWEPL